MPRKPIYNKTFPKKVYDLALKGLFDYQIWDALGISHDTFYKYMKRYPAFAEAYKKGADEGREIHAQQVVNAMLKNACGYKVQEVHRTFKKIVPSPEQAVNDQDAGFLMETKIVDKEFRPDPTSGIFLLCNWKANQYKRSHTVEVQQKVITGLKLIKQQKTKEQLQLDKVILQDQNAN